jgi:hypothetical protein
MTTRKTAIGGRVKTDQWRPSGTSFFYPAAQGRHTVLERADKVGTGELGMYAASSFDLAGRFQLEMQCYGAKLNLKLNEHCAAAPWVVNGATALGATAAHIYGATVL